MPYPRQPRKAAAGRTLGIIIFMKPQITITEILTAIVAIYGAGLSTFIFIKEQNRYKRKISIKMSFGCLTSDNALSDQMLLFEISNPGNKPVTVTGPKVILPDKQNMYFPNIGTNVGFPTTIEPGKNVIAWVPLSVIKTNLKSAGYSGTIRLKSSVEDQANNVYKCHKKLKFDLAN
jgi:hypothetical protein